MPLVIARSEARVTRQSHKVAEIASLQFAMTFFYETPNNSRYTRKKTS